MKICSDNGNMSTIVNVWPRKPFKYNIGVKTGPSCERMAVHIDNNGICIDNKVYKFPNCSKCKKWVTKKSIHESLKLFCDGNDALRVSINMIKPEQESTSQANTLVWELFTDCISDLQMHKSDVCFNNMTDLVNIYKDYAHSNVGQHNAEIKAFGRKITSWWKVFIGCDTIRHHQLNLLASVVTTNYLCAKLSCSAIKLDDFMNRVSQCDDIYVSLCDWFVSKAAMLEIKSSFLKNSYIIKADSREASRESRCCAIACHIFKQLLLDTFNTQLHTLNTLATEISETIGLCMTFLHSCTSVDINLQDFKNFFSNVLKNYKTKNVYKSTFNSKHSLLVKDLPQIVGLMQLDEHELVVLQNNYWLEFINVWKWVMSMTLKNVKLSDSIAIARMTPFSKRFTFNNSVANSEECQSEITLQCNRKGMMMSLQYMHWSLIIDDETLMFNETLANILNKVNEAAKFTLVARYQPPLAPGGMLTGLSDVSETSSSSDDDIDVQDSGILTRLGWASDGNLWINPATTNTIKINASSINADSQPVTVLINSEPTHFFTQALSDQWISVDMEHVHVRIRRYMLSVSPDGKGYPRNWNLQGSQDGQSWKTLKQHVNDKSLTDKKVTVSLTVPNLKYWSHFRIKQTGNNSKNNLTLGLCQLDIWGEVYSNHSPYSVQPESYIKIASEGKEFKLIKRATLFNDIVVANEQITFDSSGTSTFAIMCVSVFTSAAILNQQFCGIIPQGSTQMNSPECFWVCVKW